MENGYSLRVLDPSFPLLDLASVQAILEEANICIPGFIAPEVGLFDARAMFHAEDEGICTILLPDRNVVSRMAQIAAGRSAESDQQLQLSAALLGFCQCFDIEIEPEIAFHELAHRNGESEALSELRYFRAADNLHPQIVLDLALMRRSSIDNVRPADIGAIQGALSTPIRRWNRNYVLALEILDLSSRPVSPVETALGIIEWMVEEFMFGGPAALLAIVFLAPKGSPKKGLFKDRNSADRELALAGARNAAWDLTHLSDFIEKVNGDYSGEHRNYIFASFDKKLRMLAQLIFDYSADRFDAEGLAARLSEWWSEKDAKTISLALRSSLERIQSPGWAREVPLTPERVSALIESGEKKIRGLGR